MTTCLTLRLARIVSLTCKRHTINKVKGNGGWWRRRVKVVLSQRSEYGKKVKKRIIINPDPIHVCTCVHISCMSYNMYV